MFSNWRYLFETLLLLIYYILTENYLFENSTVTKHYFGFVFIKHVYYNRKSICNRTPESNNIHISSENFQYISVKK